MSYLQTGGGTLGFWCHAAVAYPLAALAVGTAAAGGAAWNDSFGDGCSFERYALTKQAEEYIAADPAMAAKKVEADRLYESLRQVQLSDQVINRTLDQIGCGCEGLTPKDVRINPALMENVKRVYLAYLVGKYGADATPALYVQQK